MVVCDDHGIGLVLHPADEGALLSYDVSNAWIPEIAEVKQQQLPFDVQAPELKRLAFSGRARRDNDPLGRNAQDAVDGVDLGSRGSDFCPWPRRDPRQRIGQRHQAPINAQDIPEAPKDLSSHLRLKVNFHRALGAGLREAREVLRKPTQKRKEHRATIFPAITCNSLWKPPIVNATQEARPGPKSTTERRSLSLQCPPSLDVTTISSIFIYIVLNCHHSFFAIS